jgi:hypothetical protein
MAGFSPFFFSPIVLVLDFSLRSGQESEKLRASKPWGVRPGTKQIENEDEDEDDWGTLINLGNNSGSAASTIMPTHAQSEDRMFACLLVTAVLWRRRPDINHKILRKS